MQTCRAPRHDQDRAFEAESRHFAAERLRRIAALGIASGRGEYREHGAILRDFPEVAVCSSEGQARGFALRYREPALGYDDFPVLLKVLTLTTCVWRVGRGSDTLREGELRLGDDDEEVRVCWSCADGDACCACH